MFSFRIVHKASQKAAIDAILDIPMDGSKTVKIVGRTSKSDRQRNYQWKLYRTILASNRGDADTTEELDGKCKDRERDLWFETDDLASELYAYVIINIPEKRYVYASRHLHTEKLSTKQMAQYLDSIIKFYGRDVQLPYPDEQGLIEY